MKHPDSDPIPQYHFQVVQKFLDRQAHTKGGANSMITPKTVPTLKTPPAVPLDMWESFFAHVDATHEELLRRRAARQKEQDATEPTHKLAA